MGVSLNNIANDLSSYLEWKLDEGHEFESVSPAVMAELESAAVKAPKSEASSPAPASKIAHSPEKQIKKEASVKNNDTMELIAKDIAECRGCSLYQVRTNTVPGQGQQQSPDILFVGEAPGADEDAQGIPFVGRSGKLLTKMIEAMGYGRDSVFIANINKCRPPDNRKPTPAEMKVCLPFLKRQIAQLQPKVIVALGAPAVEGLVGMPKNMGITKVRGQWLKFEGIDLMPTFHPAYMLRNPNMKRPVWDDLKAVLAHLGKPVPAVKNQ
jgi:DNA polymerase